MVEQVLDLFSRTDDFGSVFVGIIVDGTVGAGGHAQALQKKLAPSGRLICFDRDPEALAMAQTTLGSDSRIQFIQSSYADIERHLERESVGAVVLDLGLSTDQLLSDRGFSHQQDSALDMRFDPALELTAYEVVNRYTVARLRELIFQFGEEPFAPRIARQMDKIRSQGAIRTTGELAGVIASAVPERFRMKALARTFQALRLEVNQEIGHLERGLQVCWKTLTIGGVFCILSYHSIEDRRVKRFFAGKVKGCICPPRLPICACGKKPSARGLTPAALRPTPQEIRLNPRSRSAHLRAALKIGTD